MRKVADMLREPVAHGIIVFFLGAGLLQFLDLIDRLPRIAVRLISAGIVLTPPNAVFDLTAAGRIVTVSVYGIAILVLAISGGLVSKYLQMSRRSVADVRRLLPETAAIFKTLITKGPSLTIEGIDRTYTIRKDFSVDGVEVFTLGAASEPLSGLAVEVSSNVPSPGIESVKFRASLVDPAGHFVLTLPAENSHGRKRFLTIFFPPLMPAGHKLQNRHTWIWPGAARDLKRVGTIDRNVLVVNRRAHSPVDVVRFAIEVEADGEYEFEPEYAEDECQLERCEQAPKRVALILRQVKPGAHISIGVRRRNTSVNS